MKKFYPIVRRKFLRELLLITLIISLASTISKATTYNTNIVTNGNADLGSFTGWITTSGPTFVVGSFGFTSPQGGDVFDFYNTSTTAEYITQTISISDLSTDISNGKVKAVLSGYTYKQNSVGLCKVVLDELNASDAVVATSQFQSDVFDSWQTKSLTVNVLNTSTRKIKITLYAQLIGDGTDFAEYDGIDLKLYKYPTLTNTAASSITSSSAILGGNVTVDGSPSVTERGIVYSTINANPTVGGADVTKVAIGSGAGSYSQTISGLSGAQLYYYNAYATNTAGTVYGTVNNFTTLTPTYLTATSNEATSVTINSATLNGTVNANGNTTNCYFQYGTTISYGTQVAASPATATGTLATTESITATGLLSSTTYHFRMAAYNATEGWKYGVDKTFTTATPVSEIGIKQSATAIADGGSYNYGYYQPNTNTDIVFTIENTGTGVLTLTTPITIGGTNADQFSIQSQPSASVAVSNSTTFTVRFTPTSIGNKTATISITNNDSDENPYDLTITGAGYLPATASTNSSNYYNRYPEGIVDSGMTINGSINANNNSTMVTIEYGLTESYGSIATATQILVTGTTETSIDCNLTGLTPNTHYHYRVAGTNLGGTTYGNDQTFITPIVENFIDETAETKTFTEGATSFTITGYLKVVNFHTGFTGRSVDDYFVCNNLDLLPSAGVIGSIQNMSNNFYANSFWVQPAIQDGLGYFNFEHSGDVIIRGKRSGTVLFTKTLLSSETSRVNYTFIDLSSYNSILIDELEFEVTGNINYMRFDAFSFNFPAPFASILTTQATTNIGSTNAIGNGTITNLGNPNATAYGICYATTANPTISNWLVNKGAASATGAFTAQLTGLTPGTSYHARAFATNSEGTSYGSDVTFTTTASMTEPGNALNFDGADDYVSVPFPTTSLSSFTIETWINPTTIPESGDMAILSTNAWDAINGGIHFQFENGSVKLCVFELGSGWPTMATKLSTNKWQHVAATYDVANGVVKFYLNGVLDNAVTTTLYPTHIGAATIGAWSADRYFTGKLDELRIWNKACSVTEIQANMNHDILTSTSGLIGYYNFNEGTAGIDNTAGSTMLPDVTGNGNDGTLTNFALTGTTSNWVESYAMVVPTVVAATNLGSNSFTANWTAPSVGTVGDYLLEVATDASFIDYVSGYNPKTIASPAVLEAVSGLKSNTAYYYRVRANKTSVTGQGAWSSTQMVTTNYPATTIYETEGDWSVIANWSNGIPGTASDVTIDAACTADGDYEAVNLTINSGKVLTIAPNKTLTVSGTLTNSAGVTSLVIESDNSGTGKLITSSAVPATIKQFLTKNQWHYMGIPFAGEQEVVSIFKGLYVYKSDEAAAKHNEQLGWASLVRNDMVKSDRGYGIYHAELDTTIAVKGTLKSGSVDYPVAYSAADKGWNLIANPYPCTIDWNIGTVKTNIDGAVYVWDSANGSYMSFNGSNGTNGGSQYIAPLQGFFVKATQVGNVTFAESSKTASASTFKSATVQSIIRLALSDAQGATDESVIRIHALATEAFDGNLDAYKLKATTSLTPQLYSVYKGTEYSINSIAEVTDQTVIPFEMMIKQAGKHTVSLSELTGYNEALPIVLFDMNGKVLANLQSGDYTFEAQAGDLVQFKLAFNNTLTSTEINRNSFISISVLDRNLEITGLGNETSEIWLYNINGQLLRSNQAHGNVFNMTNLNQGVHLLKVKDSAGLISVKKVVIN